MKFQYLAIAFGRKTGSLLYEIWEVKVYSSDQKTVEVIINQAKEFERKYWQVYAISPPKRGDYSPIVKPGWARLVFSRASIVDEQNSDNEYGARAYRTELIGVACALGWEPFAVEDGVYHFRKPCEEQTE